MSVASISNNSDIKPASNVDVLEAIRLTKERFSSMTTHERIRGANNANRWLNSLVGSSRGNAGKDDGLAVRL